MGNESKEYPTFDGTAWQTDRIHLRTEAVGIGNVSVMTIRRGTPSEDELCAMTLLGYCNGDSKARHPCQ